MSTIKHLVILLLFITFHLSQIWKDVEVSYFPFYTTQLLLVKLLKRRQKPTNPTPPTFFFFFMSENKEE